MRRRLIFVVSILVSLAFLYLTLRDVPLAEVWAGIQRAEIGWVILGFLGVFGAQATRAVRWCGLLDNKIRFAQSFHILNIMMMLNQVPLRIGEVARVFLATRYNVPLVTAATSIVVERLIDVVIVVVLLAISVARLPNVPPLVAQTVALFGAGAVITFIVLITFARYPTFAHRILTWIETRLPLLKRINLVKRLEEVLDGLKPLTHWRSAVHALVWTVIAWTVSLATFYAINRALNIDGVDLILFAMMGVPLVAFSLAIPVTVAALGPFQGAVRVAGDALGIAVVDSATLGFLFHGVTVISYAVMGVIGLLTLGVSLRDVMPADQAAQTSKPKET